MKSFTLAVANATPQLEINRDCDAANGRSFKPAAAREEHPDRELLIADETATDVKHR